MPIDYRILSDLGGQQAPNRGVLETMQRTFAAGDLIKNRRNQQQVSDIFSRNVTRSPTGQSSLNKQGVLTDLYETQPEMALKFEDAWKQEAQSQSDFQKQQLGGLKLGAQILSGTSDPMAAARQMSQSGLDLGDMPPPGSDDWSMWADNRIAMGSKAEFRKPLTAKDVLAEDRRGSLELLSEEFRTGLLPTLDVSSLVTDKNARNKLIKEINQSKYWDTPLAKQVMKGLRGKGSNLAEEMAKAMQLQAIKGENRPVPAGQAVEIGGTEDAIASLDKIMVVIPNIGGTGSWTPITDPLNSLNPWNTRVQAKKQYIATIKQVIGKGLEGGVLRAEDERKYEKIIPKMGDTKDVFMIKASQLRETIVNKRKFMLKGLGNAGFNVSGFDKASPLTVFGSEAEAEKAKLPKGTVIFINGRKARVR